MLVEHALGFGVARLAVSVLAGKRSFISFERFVRQLFESLAEERVFHFGNDLTELSGLEGGRFAFPGFRRFPLQERCRELPVSSEGLGGERFASRLPGLRLVGFVERRFGKRLLFIRLCLR
ncbi:MAG: hypothetical protein JWN34_5129 [Bryobacterales bacterium]|nr:hypothetical protein [Bryobacterales bacterium]